DRLGREAPRSFALDGGGFYYDPRWSPDGKHVLFHDKQNRLAFVTLSSGKVTSVSRAQGSLGVVWTAADWSPDSEWIAFEQRNARTLYDRIALYRLSDGRTTVLTDGFGEASEPSFSRDGKLLFFTGSVDSGPTRFGLDMETSASPQPRQNIYAVVLQRTGAHPFGPRSDDGVGGDDDEDDHDDDHHDEHEPRGADREPIPPIDLDGIDQRIVAVPLPTGQYFGLQTADEGLLYLVGGEGVGDEDVGGDDGATLRRYDLEEREAKDIASDVRSYDVSRDGHSVLIESKDDWSIRKLGHHDESFEVAIDDVRVRVDPAQEWPQMLREAWRIERDYFYDPAMHGVDWNAMWERWSPFLPHVRHREDLNLLLRELIGELACGHNYVWGGELPEAASGPRTGLLGADFDVVENRFRIARIYRGQNWNPELRAPLTEPGVDVREGDFLVSVNGRPVATDQNLFAAFENTADRQTSLTVVAPGGEPRTSTVVPLADDGALRQLSWVEANRARVDRLSGGRLAYIYMPNTGDEGMRRFDRDYYSQLDKEGVILDERFNRGGKVADYVVHVLSRRVMSYWLNREQWAGRSPFATIPGPKVMVINERAGSGGDWMPWAFQRAGVGPLVGTRTWGGLVGISGYPPLMDGGTVTAASFGVMDPDGNWAVENVGVAPDVEVFQWPKEVIAGHDPQLERAV
ncbi:MAG: PDZ domain-containing protein, partial [Planctomycetes bacterium]|nr:PDZ domain-containing protein [Planctomycetota bacterium]